MREVTHLPLAVGFGISTADQVRAVGAIADGVVVGSAFERAIEENATRPDLPAQVEALARKLASGLLSRNP
jgi:tryptophan synthase alpha chain